MGNLRKKLWKAVMCKRTLARLRRSIMSIGLTYHPDETHKWYNIIYIVALVGGALVFISPLFCKRLHIMRMCPYYPWEMKIFLTLHIESTGGQWKNPHKCSLSLGHVLKVAAKKRLMRSLLFLSYINYYTPTAYILACKRAHDAAILCGFHMQKKKNGVQ